MEDPTQVTTQPIVTGTSVFGIVGKDFVAFAGDKLASYGKSARYKNVQRIHAISDSCVLAFTGEMSDMQQLLDHLRELQLEIELEDNGETFGPDNVYHYLSRVMYHRRNKFDPFYNVILIGGITRDGKPFLGRVDHRGTNFIGDNMATGLGHPLGMNVLEHKQACDNETLTEDVARDRLTECIRTVFYRDCLATNHFTYAVVRKEGVRMEDRRVQWDPKLPQA